MIPRPGSGHTLVPKPGNPNVFNVCEPDFSSVINAAVTPSFRPSPSGGVGVGGMDAEDDISEWGRRPLSSSQGGGAQGGGGDGADQGGENYGKRSRIADQPEVEGVFISDADTGTPLDPFNMDALRRHTQRRLALMHTPVVKFASSVGQKIGVEPSAMLVRAGDLLDFKARDVRAMFTSSPATQAATVQALSEAVVELLRSATVTPTPLPVLVPAGKGDIAPDAAVKDQPFSPTKAVKSQPFSPLKAAKLEKLDAEYESEEQPQVINEALRMVYEHIGPRGVFQDLALGQAPQAPASAAAAAPPSLLKQLAAFLSSLREEQPMARWVWNSLPENLGIGIIRGDVVEAMEDCHAMIRKTIPDVQMWHLITGQHVRGPFATLVAEYINEAPGELQYPNAVSTRGPNALTGTRISAGKYREERAVKRVRHQLAWFANVSYGPAEAWIYVQQQPIEATRRIAEAKAELQRWLDACKTKVDSAWIDAVRGGGNGYAEDVQSLATAWDELKRAEKDKATADADLVRGRKEKVSEDEEYLRQIMVHQADEALRDSREVHASASHNLKRDFADDWTRRLGVTGALGIHALSKAFADLDEIALVRELGNVSDVLTAAGSDVQVFQSKDAEGNTIKIFDMLTVVTSLRQAIGAVKEAQRTMVKAKKDVITFPEADKRELFHHAPPTAPLGQHYEELMDRMGSRCYASW